MFLTNIYPGEWPGCARGGRRYFLERLSCGCKREIAEEGKGGEGKKKKEKRPRNVRFSIKYEAFYSIYRKRIMYKNFLVNQISTRTCADFFNCIDF